MSCCVGKGLEAIYRRFPVFCNCFFLYCTGKLAKISNTQSVTGLFPCEIFSFMQTQNFIYRNCTCEKLYIPERHKNLYRRNRHVNKTGKKGANTGLYTAMQPERP